MKKFTLHMKPNEEGVALPPFIIGEKGYVNNQKFWQGTPKRLLGFHSTPEAGDMNVVTFLKADMSVAIIAEDIMLGINRYPVFEDDKGNWYTFGREVEKITEKTK